MDLHFSPGSVATAVAIALEETGRTYTPVRVDFAAQAQRSPEFLAVNPKGRVPALVTDDGVLTETGAILEYIGDGTDLVPSGTLGRTRMREIMYYIASTMHVAHAHKLRGARWADQASSLADMTAKVPQTMADCCAHLEDTYPFAPFALGDRISLADAYLFIALQWAGTDGVDLGVFPKLSTYVAMFDGRASARAVRAKGII